MTLFDKNISNRQKREKLKREKKSQEVVGRLKMTENRMLSPAAFENKLQQMELGLDPADGFSIFIQN